MITPRLWHRRRIAEKAHLAFSELGVPPHLTSDGRELLVPMSFVRGIWYVARAESWWRLSKYKILWWCWRYRRLWR